jgi:hypothetical protein
MDLLKKYNNVKLNQSCIQQFYEGNQQFHDAGYDAFITGAFMICYYNHLTNSVQDQKSPLAQIKQIEFKKLDLATLDQFMNLLYAGADSNFNFN